MDIEKLGVRPLAPRSALSPPNSEGTMADCVDHLNFTESTCPDCGLAVDRYGNTEAQFADYCSFPDCGCDGSRLCQAKSGANADAFDCNVEGMYSGKSHEQRTARMKLLRCANGKTNG